MGIRYETRSATLIIFGNGRIEVRGYGLLRNDDWKCDEITATVLIWLRKAGSWTGP